MRLVPQLIVALICIIVVVQYRGVDAGKLSVPMYFLIFLVGGSIASDAVLKSMRFLIGLATRAGPVAPTTSDDRP